MPDLHAETLFYLLLIVLPVAGLIARRMPILRIFSMLVTWAALFALLLLIVAQRERFDPYFARASALLKLDGQTVVGKEVRIRMSPDGHFWATVRFSGLTRRMLVDSGATVTALSRATATAAGLQVAQPTFPMLIQTANGTISVETATIANATLGNITARDLPVVVSSAFGETDVLGMNFLSRLRAWRVEGTTLVLTPHHPAEFT